MVADIPMFRVWWLDEDGDKVPDHETLTKHQAEAKVALYQSEGWCSWMVEETHEATQPV